MKKIALLFIGLTFFQSVLAQKFEDLNLARLDFSFGIHSSYLKNESLDNYLKAYNTSNAATLSKEFNNFRMLNGCEIGVKWNYLSIHYGQHTAAQWRGVSNDVERQFRVINSYVNVLGTFEVGPSKTRISIGLNTINSRFIAQVKYPNGEISRGMDYRLNGTYKGKALNGTLRIEKKLQKKEIKYFSIFAQFTGLIKDTESFYTDFNSSKAALNTGNNAITKLDAKAGFTGLLFGLNYNLVTNNRKK